MKKKMMNLCQWTKLIVKKLRYGPKSFGQSLTVDSKNLRLMLFKQMLNKQEVEALKLKDLKAKNYIFQAIYRSILETILCKNMSKQIWDSMKKKYQGNARAKRAQLQTLRGEFETLRMKPGD
ncbi:hypothetical protein KY289_022332 [Solanum tuberosum]|nr:hypothetical protein KY289_022332 [Solanum tuberosum]